MDLNKYKLTSNEVRCDPAWETLNDTTAWPKESEPEGREEDVGKGVGRRHCLVR